jgi:hypothetical protein
MVHCHPGKILPVHLDLLLALVIVRNRPYARDQPDGAVQAKEALARYRGLTCGATYAEALWSADAYPQDIL